MFSCEFCEISKNTFFTEHLRTTASGCKQKHRKPLDNFLVCRVQVFYDQQNYVQFTGRHSRRRQQYINAGACQWFLQIFSNTFFTRNFLQLVLEKVTHWRSGKSLSCPLIHWCENKIPWSTMPNVFFRSVNIPQSYFFSSVIFAIWFYLYLSFYGKLKNIFLKPKVLRYWI